MFEELADWLGARPERPPDGSWPPPPGVPPVSELKDSDDPWDQLMCIVLRCAKGDPAKDHIPTQKSGTRWSETGRSRDCCFAIYFTTNTPPPGCLMCLTAEDFEGEPAKEALVLPPHQKSTSSSTSRRHPLRDESDEAERERGNRRQAALSEVEKFLRWYEDHPDCERVEIPDCASGTDLQSRAPPPPAALRRRLESKADVFVSWPA